jgi:hypothetical protein
MAASALIEGGRCFVAPKRNMQRDVGSTHALGGADERKNEEKKAGQFARGRAI